MTRDIWIQRCAIQLIDEGKMDSGEAAALARDLADTQQVDNGRNPSTWRKPEAVAAEEIAAW